MATASPPGSGLRHRGQDADQPLRDGAARHDVAAQDEQRDRQDHLLVEADPHVLDDVLEVAAAPEQVNERGGREQHHQQRLAQRQQPEDRADDEAGGLFLELRRLRPERRPRRIEEVASGRRQEPERDRTAGSARPSSRARAPRKSVEGGADEARSRTRRRR